MLAAYLVTVRLLAEAGRLPRLVRRKVAYASRFYRWFLEFEELLKFKVVKVFKV